MRGTDVFFLKCHADTIKRTLKYMTKAFLILLPNIISKTNLFRSFFFYKLINPHPLFFCGTIEFSEIRQIATNTPIINHG